MAVRRTRWADQVRPLPGGWALRGIIVGSFVLFVVSDLFNGAVKVDAPYGWFELVLPYLPLMALLAGPTAGAVAVLFAHVLVISLGAPGPLYAASMIPAVIVTGVACYAFPRYAGLIFVGLQLLLILSVPLLNLNSFRGTSSALILLVLTALAGLSTNIFKTRDERAAQRIEELQREQARIRNLERTRLAHELHDIVAHEVTIIAMQARRAEFAADPEKTAHILESIGDAASQVLKDLRSLVILLKIEEGHAPDTPVISEDELLLDLPEPSGETTTADGLVHDIRNVVDALEHTGFAVKFAIEGTVAHVPPIIRQTLRRAVRELGTNILKHGDPEAAVQLSLVVAQQQVTLNSTNKISARTPVSSSQTGIEAMKARCEVLDGLVTAEPVADRWETTMTIPLNSPIPSDSRQGAV